MKAPMLAIGSASWLPKNIAVVLMSFHQSDTALRWLQSCVFRCLPEPAHARCGSLLFKGRSELVDVGL